MIHMYWVKQAALDVPFVSRESGLSIVVWKWDRDNMLQTDATLVDYLYLTGSTRWGPSSACSSIIQAFIL